MEGKEKYVFISKRIRDEKGRPLGFLIKGLRERDIEEIKAKSEKEFIFEVIKKGCILPEFKENYEIEQGLLAGEAYGLYSEIIKAGGLDLSLKELKGQVSNMLLRGEAEAVYCCLAAFEMGIRPKDFAGFDRKERACIEAFIDEKVRIRNKKGR